MSTPAVARRALACALPWVWAGVAYGQEPVCVAPTTNDALVTALDAATQDYDSLEIDGFEAKVEQGLQALMCLAEPITRANAAELHRNLGMRAFVRSDDEASRLAFAAARNIEPSYTFPVSRVPEGNPLLDRYSAIDVASLPTQELPYPRSGSVRLDGSAERKRRDGLPVVFQVLDDSGAVTRTVLLAGSDPVPTYPVRTDPTLQKGPQRSTFIAGLAVGVAAGGLYGWGFAERQAYFDLKQPEDVDRIIGKRSVVNGLQIASGTLGAVSLGLVTVSLVNGRF